MGVTGFFFLFIFFILILTNLSPTVCPFLLFVFYLGGRGCCVRDEFSHLFFLFLSVFFFFLVTYIHPNGSMNYSAPCRDACKSRWLFRPIIIIAQQLSPRVQMLIPPTARALDLNERLKRAHQKQDNIDSNEPKVKNDDDDNDSATQWWTSFLLLFLLLETQGLKIKWAGSFIHRFIGGSVVLFLVGCPVLFIKSSSSLFFLLFKE